MKRHTWFLLLCMMALVASACSGGGGNAQTELNDDADGRGERILKIAFFNGGYGDEWLKLWAQAFEEANPGVKVQLEGDPAITEKMGPRLESGANLPDLAFILRTGWQRWAVQGYLADLSDIYAEEIDNGMTLYEKLQPGIANYGKIRDKFWVVPWTDGATGLVYNAGMFEQYGWDVPKTVSDLLELLPKIKAEGIAPFAWGGKVASYWDFPVIGWWAQYEGVEGIETYKRMESPDVYAQEGRLVALRTFEALIRDPDNSVTGAEGMDHIQSQMAFLQGKAAMIPNGAWIENEMKNSLPDGFRMKMMQLPVVEGAKSPKVNNTMAGDIAIIPAKAQNVDLAKKFLKFTATDEMLKIFTETTGSVRPFRYDAASVEGLSEFTQSVVDIWQNSDNIYLYSDNPVYFSKFYDWPMAGAPYMMIFYEDETAESAFAGNAEYARQYWDEAKAELGLN